MPPQTSKAWKYLKKDPDSKCVKCNLCHMELVYTGGTSNMLNHLRFKHESEMCLTLEKSKQTSMSEFVNSPRSRQF